MSKIGKLPIILPEGVRVDEKNGKVVVSGPKGTLEKDLPKQVLFSVEDDKVKVSVKGENKLSKALHGTFRSIINNMVIGVSQGWSKELELVGTGYRAEVSNGDLILTVGYSHPVKIPAQEGINYGVEKNLIKVEGNNKEQVGQIAATIRAARPPEPYKGKGISYKGEVIRRKAGKAAKSAGSAA